MKKNALITLLSLLLAPVFANADIRTFDLEWSGASYDNAA